MIRIELSREAPWPYEAWDALAQPAVTAAIASSEQGGLLRASAAIEVSIRLTTDDEVRILNAQYRGKDQPTNVLSFPMVQRDLLDTIAANSDDGEVLLGDIVLAHGVCAGEAAAKGVDLPMHVTHLIVHGTLHLLGHDHQDEAAAEAMEEIERAALASLGIADPYAAEES